MNLFEQWYKTGIFQINLQSYKDHPRGRPIKASATKAKDVDENTNNANDVDANYNADKKDANNANATADCHTSLNMSFSNQFEPV